jgi:GDP-4-dehydro-6-deoxy-D-mannose reductase
MTDRECEAKTAFRALITGSLGFSGRHLTAFLRSAGAEVVELVRPGRPSGPTPGHKVMAADLRDPEAVAAAVAATCPTVVFHLAGVRPRTVAEFPEALQVNTSGTLFLLEAIAATAPRATVIVASSSAVYARQPAGVQSSEHHMACPTTLYGISKAAQELVALRYYATYGLRVIIARPFNICGPGEGRNTVAGAIAHQMAEIEAGKRPAVLQVGNLESSRDFCDVRDVVQAYWLLAQHGRPGQLYNVCSGQVTEVRKILATLVSMSSMNLEIRPVPGLSQEPDLPCQGGDKSLLTAHTDWTPTIPVERSLRDLLQQCRLAALHAGGHKSDVGR